MTSFFFQQTTNLTPQPGGNSAYFTYINLYWTRIPVSYSMKSKHWSTTCLKIYCLNTRNWRWTLLWRWCMCTWRMAWSVRSSRWWVRLTGCRIWEWNWQVSITAHSQKVDSSAEVLFFNLRCKQYLFNRHGAAANVILYSYSLVEMNKILSNCCHTTFFFKLNFRCPWQTDQMATENHCSAFTWNILQQQDGKQDTKLSWRIRSRSISYIWTSSLRKQRFPINPTFLHRSVNCNVFFRWKVKRETPAQRETWRWHPTRDDFVRRRRSATFANRFPADYRVYESDT